MSDLPGQPPESAPPLPAQKRTQKKELREAIQEARSLIEEVYKAEKQRENYYERERKKRKRREKQEGKQQVEDKREVETLLEEGARSLAFFCSYFLPHHFNYDFGAFHHEMMELLQTLARAGKREKGITLADNADSEALISRSSVDHRTSEGTGIPVSSTTPVSPEEEKASTVVKVVTLTNQVHSLDSNLLITLPLYTYALCSCHERQEGKEDLLVTPLNLELLDRIKKGNWKEVELNQVDSKSRSTGGVAGVAVVDAILHPPQNLTPQNFNFAPLKSETEVNDFNELSESTDRDETGGDGERNRRDGLSQALSHEALSESQDLSHALSHGVEEVSHGVSHADSDDTPCHTPDTDGSSPDVVCGTPSILDRLVIAAPRGHAKSTLVSLGFVLWCICYRLSNFILMISDSEDQAKMHLDAVKSELETNEKLKFVFGSLVGGTWGELAVETASGIRVQCRGTGQKIRGLKYRNHRPDLVICDDILNEELCETEDRRQKLKRWFLGAVQPALAIGGKILAIGTIFHQDDLLSDLLRSGRWESRIYDAEAGRDGQTLWPMVYTQEKLDGIKEDYGARGEISLYHREYRNQIVSNDEAEFKRHDFRYISLDDFMQKVGKKPLKFFVTVDPAYRTEKRMDFTVLAVTAIDANRQVYIVEFSRGRYSQPKIFEEWFKLNERYKPQKNGMQIQDWSRFFKVVTQDEMRKRGVFFNVTELQTYSPIKQGLASKKSRISRMSKYYASHSVIHVKECPHLSEYENELIAHPFSRYDDMADCVSMATEFWFPPQKAKTQRNYPKWLDEVQANKVSGY